MQPNTHTQTQAQLNHLGPACGLSEKKKKKAKAESITKRTSATPTLYGPLLKKMKGKAPKLTIKGIQEMQFHWQLILTFVL